MIGIFSNLYRGFEKVLTRRWGSLCIFFIALIAYSSTGFMYFEMENIAVQNDPDVKWMTAIWWSIVTMTTVGYGDYFPETFWGRVLVGIPTMIVGVGVLGYILSTLASIIMESKLKEIRGMANTNVHDHIIMIHYTGQDQIDKIVHEIREDKSTENTSIVLVDEHLSEMTKELIELGIVFVKGNPARESTLERANLSMARHCIIQADHQDPANSDHRNLAVALTVERLHPEVQTVVHCLNPGNVPFYEKAGVDGVVCIESLAGQMMVQELQDPGVHEVLTQLTTNEQGKQFYIVDTQSGDVNYEDVKSRLDNTERQVIGIQRGERPLLLPESGCQINRGDRAILIAAERP